MTELKPTDFNLNDLLLNEKDPVDLHHNRRQYRRLASNSYPSVFDGKGYNVGELVSHFVSAIDGSHIHIVLTKEKLKREKTIYCEAAFCFRYLLFCPHNNHVREYITFEEHIYDNIS